MKLVADDIETMRIALRAYWTNAGHVADAPEALCDLALKGLRAEPDASDAKDAARYRFALHHAAYYSMGGAFIVDVHLRGPAGPDMTAAIDAAIERTGPHGVEPSHPAAPGEAKPA